MPLPLPSRPIPFSEVTIRDPFWSPKLRVNREISLPFQYRQLRETGRIDALRLDWTPGSGRPAPHHYWDSDTAKWVEAASYCLAAAPDPELRAQLDEVAGLFAAAQQPDGYLNSRFTVTDRHLRWKNLRDNHELYGAGHLIEAAVAHHQALGSRQLLDVAIRFADHIGAVFGREAGRVRGYCGHEEIELALVRLWQATGERRFLDLASYFVEERGQPPLYFETEAGAGSRAAGFDPAYYQAHRPVREQTGAVGHAVRAMYLYTAMADLAREQGDATLLAACERLWHDVAETKLYVTGQVGSTWHGEAFTRAYDLPNETAYCETCAGVGWIFWNHRMLQLDCDARYADEIERSLYNGVLSGVALDGKSFFYQNPLFDRGEHRRQGWFDCSCCPSNLSRLLAALGSQVASVAAGGIAIHQYIAGEFQADLPEVGRVQFQLESGFPWEGTIVLTLRPERPGTFPVALRVPGWARSHALSVDGAACAAPLRKGYAVVERNWRGGERVAIEFPLPVERIASHPAVASNRSQTALRRGPVVYCLEEADHGVAVENLALPRTAELSARFVPGLLGGVTVLEGTGRARDTAAWMGKLYQPAGHVISRSRPITAIPYFAWANRTPGGMTVWIAED